MYAKLECYDKISLIIFLIAINRMFIICAAVIMSARDIACYHS